MLKELILPIVVFLVVVIFPTFVLIKNSTNSDKITVADMKRCERLIKKHKYSQFAGQKADAVAKELKLAVVEVCESELGDKLSMLCPPDDSGKDSLNSFNGVIKYTDSEDKNFKKAHEIIHYIKDVGIGEKVSCSYGKDKTGSADKTYNEQVIDYMAAAMLMPFEEIKKAIKNKTQPKELHEHYDLPENVILRRINEVRSLQQLCNFW